LAFNQQSTYRVTSETSNTPDIVDILKDSATDIEEINRSASTISWKQSPCNELWDSDEEDFAELNKRAYVCICIFCFQGINELHFFLFAIYILSFYISLSHA
jgi:hypothetical protein